MARIKDPDVLAQNSIVMVWYPGKPADTLKSQIPDHNNGPKHVQIFHIHAVASFCLWIHIPENNVSTGAACPLILNIMMARCLNAESNFDGVFQNEIGSRPSMKSFSLVAIYICKLWLIAIHSD